jgi:DNA-binding NtrC family response regulator
VAHLDIPPLRSRREDIRPLVAHTLSRSSPAFSISGAAMAALEAYKWPGNIRELQNVVEQMIAMSDTSEIGVDHLPPSIRASERATLTPARERRRQLADDLFEKLTTTQCDFWEHVYPAFMTRDLTRADLRQLVARGLTASGGNYRGLLRLFGMADDQYKRFLNFLASHDCTVDFRNYRPSTRLAPGLTSDSPRTVDMPFESMMETPCY